MSLQSVVIDTDFQSRFDVEKHSHRESAAEYGHEPLTEEEHKQMVSIAQNPSDELFSLLVPQDMIDGVSGATKSIFKDKVVDKAGYSSWRIARLAIDTASIIEGSPRQRDADRLRQMLKTAETDAEQRSVIVDFIPTAESDYLKGAVDHIGGVVFERLIGR